MSQLPTVSLTPIEPTPPANPAANMVFQALSSPPLLAQLNLPTPLLRVDRRQIFQQSRELRRPRTISDKARGQLAVSAATGISMTLAGPTHQMNQSGRRCLVVSYINITEE